MRQFSIGLFILATLGGILLAGHSFDLKAFGGDGFTSRPSLNINGVEWRRGSTYTFESNATIAPYSNIEITGEKGTSIVFFDTRSEYFTLRLDTGRVSTRGDLDIQVNRLLINTVGASEVIHYSWKNEAEITVREGTASVNSPTGEVAYSSPANIYLSTQTGMAIER